MLFIDPWSMSSSVPKETASRTLLNSKKVFGIFLNTSVHSITIIKESLSTFSWILL
jgi:hypothetical protein